MDKYGKRNNKQLRSITPEALGELLRYNWPGNIRELENVIERAVVMARGEVIDVGELPTNITGSTVENTYRIPYGTPLKDIEKLVICDTLKFSKGDKNLTAKILGVAPRTIYRKLDEYESA
jgi:two-component system response regulator HydG